MTASPARAAATRSDSGTPIMSAMVRIGSSEAQCSTKSTSPAPMRSSTISRAALRICSSISRTCRRVNAALTSSR